MSSQPSKSLRILGPCERSLQLIRPARRFFWIFDVAVLELPGPFLHGLGKDMDVKHGYLLITDITGYTEFLVGSELDHAKEILDTLLVTGYPVFDLSNRCNLDCISVIYFY